MEKYEKLAVIDATLLPGDHPETYVRRVVLQGADQPSEFQINPRSHSRVEIVVDGHIISIGYEPPKSDPYEREFEEMPPAKLRTSW